MLPRRRIAATVLALLFLFAACGDSGDDSSASGDEADPLDAPAGDVDGDDTGGDDQTSEDELPAFKSDFDRLCTTQVGFGGAAVYTGEPGIHPVVLLEDFRDNGTFIASSADLPAGWLVEEDTDFDDNSELAVAELVACLDVSSTAPTGVECDLEADEDIVTLELVDATYELTVYEARTGDELGVEEIEATEGGECPFFAAFQEGDTERVASPDDDQLTVALKDYVELG